MNLFLWSLVGSFIPVLLFIIRETTGGKLPAEISEKGYWGAQLCKSLIALLTVYFMQDYFPEDDIINPSLLALACGYAGADILGALLNKIVKIITPSVTNRNEILGTNKAWYEYL